MAIRQANKVAVDRTAYQDLAVQITKRIANRETGELKLDRATGLPVWSIDCLRTDRSTGEIATIAVSVPAAHEPKGIVGQHVEFQNLLAMQWQTDSGAGLAFRADSVSPVGTGRNNAKAEA